MKDEDAIDKLLNEGLHEIPVRQLSQDFDAKVLSAMQPRFSWKARLQPFMQVAAAVAACALVLSIIFAVGKNLGSRCVSSMLGASSQTQTAPGVTVGSPHRASDDTQYGTVLAGH